MAFEIEDGVLKKYIEEEGVTEVVIPDGVTEIADSAFEDCESLTNITFPDSVKKIGKFAFRKCSNLTSIKLPDFIWRIAPFTFFECQNLTSVTLPKRLKYIGFGAFEYCWRLTSVTLPEGVTRIDRFAFYHCEALTIDLPESVTKIGTRAFQAGQSICYHEKGFSCVIKLQYDWIEPTDSNKIPDDINSYDDDYDIEHMITDNLCLHHFITCKKNFIRRIYFNELIFPEYKVPLALLMIGRRDATMDYHYYLGEHLYHLMDYVFKFDDAETLSVALDQTFFISNV